MSSPIVNFGHASVMILPSSLLSRWRGQVNASQAIDILLAPAPAPAATSHQLHHKDRGFDFLPSSMQPLGSDALECAICLDFVHLPDGAVQHFHVLPATAGAKPRVENGWRSECGRIMCAVCVSRLRHQSPSGAKCPSCRAELDAHKLWKVTQLTPVPLHTRLALKQLAVQCRACKQLDIAGDFDKHLQTCSAPAQPGSPNSSVQASKA